MAKIQISHTEVEHKILLESLAVFSIFALLLAGIYVLEPAITGFVTVTKQLNYTDAVSLEFNESGEYIWNADNIGDLKNIRIDGSKSKLGQAKVYIENDGIKYLIFDSSQLVKKDSGIFGITAFAVKEDKENKTKDNPDGKEKKNNAPVWNSSIDSFEINSTTAISLNEHYYDADNDVLAYSSSSVDNVSIAISNEIVTLVPDDNIDAVRQVTFAAYDGVNITYKIVSLVINTTEYIDIIAPINETPILNQSNETTINQTQPINETIGKIIDINLEYGDNDFYDANNDGIEELNGVIDFTTADTEFNWDANENNLCTRYEVNSVDNEESTFLCYGSGSCCAFVELASSRELWNDSLYLTYNGYGSTFSNVVYAQVLHVDYNLSLESPYTDIAYSFWANLSARFEKDIIEFENICIDTCLVSGFNGTSYKLIIEIENR